MNELVFWWWKTNIFFQYHLIFNANSQKCWGQEWPYENINKTIQLTSINFGSESKICFVVTAVENHSSGLVRFLNLVVPLLSRKFERKLFLVSSIVSIWKSGSAMAPLAPLAPPLTRPTHRVAENAKYFTALQQDIEKSSLYVYSKVKI